MPPSLDDIVAALQQMQLARAEGLARTYLKRAPKDEGALILLGLSLQRQHRPQEAVEIYRQLVGLLPDAAHSWNNLGTALREADAFDEAKQTYRHALRLDPDYYNASMNLGFLHEDLGEYDQALDAYLKALSLDRPSAEARIHAAQMCFSLAENARGLELIEPRSGWHELPDDLAILLASLLMQFGKIEEARATLQQVLSANPANVRARAKMVVLCERMNQLDEARALLEQLPAAEALTDLVEFEDVSGAQIAMALRETDAQRSYALLDQLQSRFAKNRRVGEDWYFLLGGSLAKRGEPDQAMQALAQAHAIQLETARLVVPDLLLPGAQPLRTASIWIDAAQRRDWREDPESPGKLDSPIFVVGFPRSGTTMLEQMLDAHPGLKAMDERAFLQNVVERMSDFGLRYPQQLGELMSAQCEQLRSLYWSLCEDVAPRAPGQRMVDKNPLNMLRLPLINRLFPQAPIILALRHPCDVILSCYMQHFRSPAFAVLCSSLERLAHGYVNAMRFWIHHAELLKPDVMNLRYEDLLDDFPRYVERIGQFIGVEDSAPMAGFDSHARGKGYIGTPSYTQVVEPPHKRAVGRWRAYQAYFEPILPILQPIMEHWGYER